MESNLIDAPSDPGGSGGSSGAESQEDRIKELLAALKEVGEKFHSRHTNFKNKICIWAIICILILIACTILAVCLLKINFPDNWTWQIAYETAIRITIATAISFIASFCFKILKSYIHMNEHNQHCIMIVESMAYLVGSAREPAQRDSVYNKLIEIITNAGNVGIMKSDDDLKLPANISFELLQKIFSKKE